MRAGRRRAPYAGPVDLHRARALLDVEPGDDWAVIRANYRRLIVAVHPDRADVDDADDAIELNQAYRTLAIARREGRLDEEPVVRPERVPPTAPQTSAPPRAWADAPGTADDVRIVDDNTLVFRTLPTETFIRLVEAANHIGHISYVDRSAALLEVMVRLRDETPASLVFSLQWRAHDATCEAFATLEAIDRPERLEVGGVLEQLCEFIPPAE